ncbi:MAG: HNH endonuclease, partial [Clostridia bacterium]|nr:HNH endonuclease [Clostridia bacterium]
ISKYNNYIRQTQSIKSSAPEEFCNSFGFTLTKFLKYEERVFKSKTLRKPQDDVVIYCKATYTSPQGRNHYWKEQSYHYGELKRFFDHTVKLKAQRQTRQYQIKVERAKMTDSLRYDILKRDNFRCQICGSSAQDGVKLHVDHIIPVAKGGQTIASNLRTLCDRCNMGKSDKM